MKHGYSPTRTDADHEYIRKFFRELESREGSDISRVLDRLRKYRNQADYEDTLKNPPYVVEWTIMGAENILEKIDNLSVTDDAS